MADQQPVSGSPVLLPYQILPPTHRMMPPLPPPTSMPQRQLPAMDYSALFPRGPFPTWGPQALHNYVVRQNSRPRRENKREYGAPYSNEANSRTLMVRNLPYNVTDEELIAFFQRLSPTPLQEVRFSGQPRTRARAWLQFSSLQEAQDARRLLTEDDRFSQLGGRSLGVDFSHQDRRDSRNQDKANNVSVEIKDHESCWFCMTNPNFETRLIVRHNKYPSLSGDLGTYTTVAKGGINGTHFLIVPRTHYPGIAFVPPPMVESLEREVSSLRAVLASEGFSCSLVWERYFPMRNTGAMHMQIQVLGLKAEDLGVEVSHLSERFAFDNLKYLGVGRGSFEFVRAAVYDVSDSYTYIELRTSPDSGSSHSWFVHSAGTDGRSRMSTNLGREFACFLTRREHLVDWKRCTLPDVEENAWVSYWSPRLAALRS